MTARKTAALCIGGTWLLLTVVFRFAEPAFVGWGGATAWALALTVVTWTFALWVEGPDLFNPRPPALMEELRLLAAHDPATGPFRHVLTTPGDRRLAWLAEAAS